MNGNKQSTTDKPTTKRHHSAANKRCITNNESSHIVKKKSSQLIKKPSVRGHLKPKTLDKKPSLVYKKLSLVEKTTMSNFEKSLFKVQKKPTTKKFRSSCKSCTSFKPLMQIKSAHDFSATETNSSYDDVPLKRCTLFPLPTKDPLNLGRRVISDYQNECILKQADAITADIVEKIVVGLLTMMDKAKDKPITSKQAEDTILSELTRSFENVLNMSKQHDDIHTDDTEDSEE